MKMVLDDSSLRPSVAIPHSTEESAFLRLWHGFLTGRVMVALALLVLQLLSQAFNHQDQFAELAACLGYLAATLALRWLKNSTVPAPHAGPQWLPSIGIDLAFICILQWLHTGSMNFTPLFGLPILMAAVLGSLTLALGTTAAATLFMLAWAWWLGEQGTGDSAQRYLQAALTCTGYFVLAFLAHQLAARLVREQKTARHSKLAALVQSQVSTLVIQNLNDGVLVVDRQGAVHLSNPASLRLLPADTHTSAPWLLSGSQAWEPLRDMVDQTFNQQAPQTANATLLSPGQRPISLHVRTWLTEPVDTATQAVGERMCVMFLHDLREMEARLRTEKLASMGRMSAAVAHEIRNPLAAIVQANALLGEGLQDPMQQRLSGMVQQNADRLVRITEEVLDIARVQHQLHHGAASALALDTAVSTVWHDWCAQDPVHRRGKITLNAEDLPVEFDAEHLRRVLVNLLDNALRYCSNAGDALQLCTSLSAKGVAQVQVWSDGQPMDQSVERHLFEPFFSSESRSSGLGLYICRELCERHGASIGYRRTAQTTAAGAREGNAFMVHFRSAGSQSQFSSLFDTIVV